MEDIDMPRENKYYDDTTYTCQLLEQVSRMSNNNMRFVIETIGLDGVEHIYKLADVYHCDSPEYSGDFIIEKYKIPMGSYIKSNHVPVTTIGRSLGTLVLELIENKEEIPSKIHEVLGSWWMPHIDNYNSSLYYETPSYQAACYRAGEIIA
ncbi:MAG: hypothetical protein ACRDCW_06255 [Sarcina sp.]